MRILQIVFLLSVCGCPQALSQAISDILEIENMSKDIKIDVVKEFKSIYENVALSPKAKDQRLFEKFKVITKKINMLYAQLHGIGSLILYGIAVHTDIDSEEKLKLLNAANNIYLINVKYQYMENYLNNKENDGLEAFARDTVSHSHRSLQTVLDIIHDIIAPSKIYVRSGFKILHEHMKWPGNKLFCKMHTSEQELVLYLYDRLALAEVKGFLLMEFSYMLLQLHNEGNFNKEIEATLERYKDRSATTLKLTIEAVKVAGRDLWNCDPNEHVKNVTYIEITELLQGYIENEENLNLARTCNYTCPQYVRASSYNCADYGGQTMFCTRNRECKGKLSNCRFIPDATVCHAHAGTNRRYEYIAEPGTLRGLRKECAHTSTIRSTFLQGSTCDYCMCLCDEQGVNSDRFFNLRSSESDIDRNMVVTGLRFVKKNRIIHFQIQEAKLLPSAQLDLTTLNWKPVEDYRIDDPRVRNGVHYHTLDSENRKFDLDDLVAEDNQLLTGVKFAMIGSHLNFQIRVTPFNFKTGRLEARKSKWKHNEVSEKNRRKINLDNKDIPIKSKHSFPLSRSGMYLEFTPTDISVDLQQTTIPFIDAQTVKSSKPVPLSGAGVLYKGSNRFGGFIYPKITTYGYSGLFLNAHDDTL